MTRRLRDERGAAALEFALVLPILIMLVMGIIEFSRAYNAKEALQYAVREGARELAINGNAGVAQAVTVDRAIGLTLTTAQVTATGCSGAATTTAEVTATYSLPYQIPFWGSGSWPLSATGVMRCNG